MKIIFSFLFCFTFSCPFFAQPVSFPEPGHEGLNIKEVASIKIDDVSKLHLGFWTQNRVMYNLSNIPGPGGTDFSNTTTYDFFRQRFRAALDVRFVDSTRSLQTGVYTQFEYRGGWGGSSPSASDPRIDDVIMNPYNRLQARGIRYGFVYLNYKDKFNLSAGLLPLTDGLGRVLFDADWDFNVGGVALGGTFLEKGSYRLAYVRLVDGIGAPDPGDIGRNGNLFLIDQAYPVIENLELGLHLYGLTIPEEFGLTPVKRQFWIGLNIDGQVKAVKIGGVFILNTGKFGNETNTGLAGKLGVEIPVGKSNLAFTVLVSSGDDNNQIKKRFVTLHQIVGTAGYWGLGHIYTANGPSDVNDLGLEIGNRGAGLATLQGRYSFPLLPDKINANLHAGWFRAMNTRNNSKEMGAEFGGMLTFSFARFLSLDTGAAYATMGNYFAQDADGVFEVFSRFQFTW